MSLGWGGGLQHLWTPASASQGTEGWTAMQPAPCQALIRLTESRGAYAK